MSQTFWTEFAGLVLGPPSDSASFFGWEFPRFLVWWSLLLVGGTLLSGAWLLGRSLWLRAKISGPAALLKKLQRPGTRMLPDRLEKIESLLKGNPLLGPGWFVFKEGLIEETQGNGDVVAYLTRHANESFQPEVVEHKISPIHRLMPATLTSCGLLGTFVALLFGLHAVRVDTETPLSSPTALVASGAGPANLPGATGDPMAVPAAPDPEKPGADAAAGNRGRPASRIRGVDGLVNSLSGKFLSSIVALVLAIFYSIFEASIERRLRQSLEGFCSALDSLFTRRTPEALLIKIHEDLASQSASFRSFNTDLSGYLRQSFQESLGPTLENLNSTLSDRLERLSETLGEVSSSSAQKLGEIASSMSEKFHSNLTSAASGEFEEMRKTLAATSGMITAMNEQSQSMQSTIPNLIGELDRSRREQAEGVAAQQEALKDLLRGFSDHLRGMTSQSSSALDSSMQQLLERTGQWSTQTASSLGSLLEQQMRSFEERTAQLLDRLSIVAEQMSRASANGSEQMSGAIASLVQRLEESVTTTAAVLRDAGSGVARQTGETSEKLHASLIAISEGQREGLAAQERTLQDLLRGFSDSMKAMTSQSRSTQDSAMQQLLEQTGELSTQTANRVGGLLEQQSRSIEDRTAQLLDRLTLVTEQMSHVSANGNDQMTGTIARLEESALTMAAVLGDAGSGVARQTSEVSNKIHADVVAMSERMQATMATMAERQREQADGMAQARQSLDEAARRTREVLGESAAVFERARLAAGDFNAAGVALRQTAEAARSQAEASHSAAAKLPEIASGLDAIAWTHRALLEEHKEVFEYVKNGLGQTLGQVDEALRRYHMQTSEALQKELQTFDASFANAVQRIGSLVEDLAEGLQGLEDALEGTTLKLGSGNGTAGRI